METTTINASDAAQATVSANAEIGVHEIDVSGDYHSSHNYWAWMNLFESDPTVKITQHPDHVLHEINEMAGAERRASYLVTSTRNGTANGIGILLPKTYTTREVIGFGPSRTLYGYRIAGDQFLGDADVHRSLMHMTLAHVHEIGGSFVLLEDVVQSSPLWELCESAAEFGFRAFHPKGVQPRLQINFPESADDYWKQFKSNRRWNFRKKLKNFGDHRVVRVTEVDQVSEFLKDAHEVSKNSWQAQYLGLRVCNDDNELKMFTFLATHGALRSYIIYKDDTPAAFIIGTQHNGYYDHSEIGYDLQFSRLSSGLVLLLSVLDDMFEHDTPEWLDFGGGDAEYKQSFTNHKSQSGNICLIPPGLRAAATLAYLKAGLGVNRLARRVLAESGFFHRVRQWTRSGAVKRNA